MRNDPVWVEIAARGGPRKIWGRGLRFVLVAELMKRPEATVAELVAWMADQGYELRGRASKVISDCLRWEIRGGRVVRLGRGRYAYRRAPVSTARRIRAFARQAKAWIVAVTRGQQPPPTPPSKPPGRRASTWPGHHDPTHPPWDAMNWLWTL